MTQTLNDTFFQMHLSLKCHQDLYQDCWRRESKESKRVDFVTQFPFEVASTVLQGLSTADLFEAMKVSHGWRHRIMNSPNLWHDITITDNQYELIPKLSTIGKHIRKYALYDGGAKVVDGSLNMMFYGSLCNVRSLSKFEIFDAPAQKALTVGTAWENCLCDHRDILDSLRYLSTSLTELTLIADWEFGDYTRAYDTPHLLSILEACPGLKRLNVALPLSDIELPVEPAVLPNTPPLKLTHLNWTTGSPTQQSEIEAVLASCPDLRYLQIGAYDGDPSILFVPDSCPSLEFLSIDDSLDGYFPDTDYWDNDSPQPAGLRAFVGSCTTADAWDQIKSIVASEARTLEKLTVYYDCVEFDAGHLIRNFRGKWLNLYGCNADWERSAELDATIIGHDNDNIVPRLWHVHCTFKLSDHESQVAAFIAGLKVNTAATSHRVTRLRLTKSPSGGGNILPLLLDFPALQALQLDSCVFLTDALTQFARTLASRSCSTLNYVGFSMLGGLTDDVLMELASAPELQTLKLWHCDYLTDKGMRDLVEVDSDLGAVDIFQCKQVTWSTISYVQERLDKRRVDV